jgi:sugar phosphate isomerase/epimerase
MLFLMGGARAGDATSPNPFFAFCMDTHDGKKRSLSEQAELLHELGYAGAGHLWLDQVAERIKTLDAAGLRLFQIYIRVNLAPEAKPVYDPRLKEILPLLKGHGTTLAVLMGGGKPSDETIDVRAVEVLREMADLARPHGVKLAVYPHVGDWLERVEDAMRVVKKVGRSDVGIMFNLCHWMKTDEEQNLEAVLRAVRPHLLAVSINGCDRVVDVRAGRGQWIAPLDTGTFDMLGFLRMLKDLGYDGPVGLQCYGIAGDAREHLTRSIKAWRDMRSRLGKGPPDKAQDPR